MLLAGTDTGAAALIVGFYGVLSNPKVLEKFTQELDAAFPSVQDVDVMSTDKMRRLPYLVCRQSNSVESSAKAFGSKVSSHQRVAPALLRRSWAIDSRRPTIRDYCRWLVDSSGHSDLA